MPKKAEPTGFGAKLKAVREAAGLTQDQLAEKAGLYKFSIAKIEQGVREPTWSTVQALAKALGVDCTAFQVEEAGPVEEETPVKKTRGKRSKKQ
jgi:transcriptional regulator with XRE-family HTH domain